MAGNLLLNDPIIQNTASDDARSFSLPLDLSMTVHLLPFLHKGGIVRGIIWLHQLGPRTRLSVNGQAQVANKQVKIR